MANEFKIKKGLIVTGASGGTVVDIQGSQGQLFSVTDDLSGSIFAVSDISGVPILDVNSSGLSTFDGNVNLPDNNKLTLGTGNDLEIYHDGSHSYIRDQGSGNLIITGSQLTFSNVDDTEYMVKMVQDGSVELYYDGSKKLETTSTGVSITGTISADDNIYLDGVAPVLSVSSSNNASGFRINVTGIADSTNNLLRVQRSGTTMIDTRGNGNTTFTAQAFSAATSSGDGSSTLTTKGYVDGLITGATIYRGAWDPSGGGYGSPDLSGVTQTSGYYYICSADGTAEPNGTGTEPDTWAVGDWVIYNDVSGTGQWQKIDNSSVLSGVGTGQTVALWEGAGSVTDSETLGNAPITVSGNDTAFAGNITAYTGGGSGSLGVGRTSNQSIKLYITDTNNSITAEQDSDENAAHKFILNRVFDGTGANDFIIQKDGTAQFTLDTSGNVGIGVTPWDNNLTTSSGIDFKGRGGVFGYNDSMYVTANTYYSTGWKYKSTHEAGILHVDGNTLTFRQAVSGTIGTAISFTTPFVIGGTGNATFSGSVTSPTFLGDLNGTINTATTGTTQTAGNNSTLIATTAYADAAAGAVPIGNYLPLSAGSSYPLTGNLFIEGASTPKITITDTTNNLEGRIRVANNYMYIEADTDDAVVSSRIVLRTDGVEALYLNGNQEAIFPNGNVGIGNTSPDFRLHTNLNLSGSPLAYLNGTSNTFDATANLGVTHNSTAVGTGTAAGVYLANNANDNGAPSPIVAFSALSASGTYNHTYAAIYGIKTAGGADTNWVKGDLTFATGNTTGPERRMTIDSTGNVGIGTTSPRTKLNVSGSSADGGGVLTLENSTTATGNADYVGKIQFYGNDSGTGASGIRASIDANIQGYNGETDLVFSTAPASGVNAERVRIDSSGNVGIGNTNPSDYSADANNLVVGSLSGNNGITILSTASSGYGSIYFADSTAANKVYSGFIRYQQNISDMTFGTNEVERMRLTLEGYLGIGTTSPSEKLEITGSTPTAGDTTLHLKVPTGNITAGVTEMGNILFSSSDASGGGTGSIAKISTIAGTGANAWIGGGRPTDLAFFTQPLGTSATLVEAMRIDQDGNVGIGTTSPLAKLDIQGTQGQLFSVTDDLSGSIFAVADISGVPIFDVNSSGVSYFDGNVGIGTANPGYPLHVYGTIRTTLPSDNSYYSLFSNNGSLTLDTYGVNSGIQFKTLGSTKLTILNGGNVGIGDTNPFYKLQVQDRIHIEDTATLQPKISFSENTNSSGEFVLEYNGVGGGAGNYVSFYSEVTGWVPKGNGLNYIPQNGRVGIGTTSPDELLDVENGNIRLKADSDGVNGILRLYDAAGVESGQIYPNSGDLRIYSPNDILFNQSGNVGIGNTSPTGKLDIFRTSLTYAINRANTLDRAGLVIKSSGNFDSKITFSSGASSVQYIQALNNSATVGRDININPYGGNVITAGTMTATNFILSSDEKLKENIEKACDNRIKADWKTFELKTDKGQKRYGVIAQELEKTNPEFIREDTQGFKSVAYIDLLIAKIAELEARLEKAGI